MAVSDSNSTASKIFTDDYDDWQIAAEKSRVVSRNVISTPLSGASAGPSYHLDKNKREVVGISKLYSAPTCLTATFRRKIVQRHFENNNKLLLSGFVIEEEDGSRTFINVDVDFAGTDNVTRAWVSRGLNTLIAEGRSARVAVKTCGASGRVSFLDAAY